MADEGSNHNREAAGTFSLPLSLQAAACFLAPQGLVPAVLRVATRFARRPAILEIRQTRRSPPEIEALSTNPASPATAERASAMGCVS